MDKILDQFIEFHRSENWQNQGMSDHDLTNYYQDMMLRGRIITLVHENKLLGFLEYTRLNLSQLGYVILARDIDCDMYDPKGIAVYVTDIQVSPEYRGRGIVEYFKGELLRRNPSCNFIVGEKQGRKNFKKLIVLKRSQKSGKI